jgi:hypothetical protein
MMFTSEAAADDAWDSADCEPEGIYGQADDYPGDYRWRFVGGTIHKAVIDVSGKPFVDLAQEARMAFARD